MYFILSKILLFLLFPLLWIFALLTIALLAKSPKRRKRFFIIALIMLYFFSAPFFLNQVADWWSVKPGRTNEPKVYSCAIILGGFSSIDKNNVGYFNGSADRFIQGLKALSTGKATHIMITGGNGSLFPGGFSEASWVKTQLNAFKVPDSLTLIESRSRNTIENAVFSKPMLQKAGLKPPYMLITSDFHMRRSLMIFQKEGYDVVPYPCNLMAGHTDNSLSDLIPDGSSVGGWNLYFKEIVGYVVDRYK
jgi:uncharacterized SAM-binding protein YcdF (DUF218 family)